MFSVKEGVGEEERVSGRVGEVGNFEREVGEGGVTLVATV